jgi:hypothetical protein
MGIQMVATLTSSSLEYIGNASLTSAKTSSIVASYSDPDLLIREYFSSSSEQREKSRKIVIKHIETLASVFAVLSWGASGKAREGYDGAVNLLAEIGNLQLLSEICQNVRNLYFQMATNSSTRLFAENFIEILIKAIACAYKTDAHQRLRLLTQALPPIDNRMIKSSTIDALVILSDEVDLNKIKQEIERYISDSDQYICDYAREALQDIG